jgi:hypothetical protein
MSVAPSPQRPVSSSIEGLVHGADAREPLVGPGKSGAVLERVRIDGRWFVLKHLDADRDWTIRAAGVPGGAAIAVWRRGLLDRLPACFVQPVIAAAQDPDDVARGALLMEDVGAWLVPAVDDPVPATQHERFLDHLAALHASFWQAADVDLVTPWDRYQELSPAMAEREAALGSDHLVPRLVAQGWPLFAEVAPVAAAVVSPLTLDPGRLIAALESTPQTFVHGNWKFDNLGSAPDGRTVLLDWELPGRGAPLSDLAWYLAINCRRIPTSKEDAIAGYRDALERHGVATSGWWERQLDLCLLGALVQFGWEKALGGYDDELAWWEDRAVRAARWL